MGNKERNEENKIIITDEGMKVRGFEGSAIVASLIEALCHAWKKEVGPIDIMYAGKKVVDTLADAENVYKINAIYDVLTEDDAEDEDDEDECE